MIDAVLIKRVRSMIELGVPVADIRESLQKSGTPPRDQYFAFKAAQVLIGSSSSGEEEEDTHDENTPRPSDARASRLRPW